MYRSGNKHRHEDTNNGIWPLDFLAAGQHIQPNLIFFFNLTYLITLIRALGLRIYYNELYM